MQFYLQDFIADIEKDQSPQQEQSEKIQTISSPHVRTMSTSEKSLMSICSPSVGSSDADEFNYNVANTPSPSVVSMQKLTKICATNKNFLNNTNKQSVEDLSELSFEALDKLDANSSHKDVKATVQKYCSKIKSFTKSIKTITSFNISDINYISVSLDTLNDMITRTWADPTLGNKVGYALCNELRKSGCLDFLIMKCCEFNTPELQFRSAKLLAQCLTTENVTYVVHRGLKTVVAAACSCIKLAKSYDHSRSGTEILEHLFKSSESTCCDIINLGGLDAVLYVCRSDDIETLRHCASALANLSLFGGPENQEVMIQKEVPMWLFPLAFHSDDQIKYYACLAIAVLVVNKEIEAIVLKSGTLDLVEPFVTSRNPSEFAKSIFCHAQGQNKNWLQRLVPVLCSKIEKARNLAAFHFCLEAGIKKHHDGTKILKEIGATESLKKVASCPNAVASKYAVLALQIIGEKVPRRLSQKVLLWSIDDVKEWISHIYIEGYKLKFVKNKVDGDLLLQLTEKNLKDDIGITNGIERKRFIRELQQLKMMADYSSQDSSRVNDFLKNIDPEYTIYTYSMIKSGVDMTYMRRLTDDQLQAECNIQNSIHRDRILEAIKELERTLHNSGKFKKNLDVFISYRRSNGSQLASLLKVHLQLRGFSVFIDVERLEAGKFDNNLLQSIRQAKFFLLVLTPNALDRCKQDREQKDWVHKEIYEALNSQCTIVPIIDKDFQWPVAEDLPEDMRAVCRFNGVAWVHDYQDACIDKVENFLRSLCSNTELSTSD